MLWLRNIEPPSSFTDVREGVQNIIAANIEPLLISLLMQRELEILWTRNLSTNPPKFSLPFRWGLEYYGHDIFNLSLIFTTIGEEVQNILVSKYWNPSNLSCYWKSFKTWLLNFDTIYDFHCYCRWSSKYSGRETLTHLKVSLLLELGIKILWSRDI